MEKRGFRSEQAGLEMYRLSEEAYQRAVTLSPLDADWHYGFAELLCWNAEWNYLFQPNIDAWKACALQLKLALELKPGHEKSNDLLRHIAEIETINVVDVSGVDVIFLILTPQPDFTETPVTITSKPTLKTTKTSMPTELIQPTGMSTLNPIETIPFITNANINTATLKAASTPLSGKTDQSLCSGAFFLAGIVSLGIVLFRKRNSNFSKYSRNS